MENQEAQRSTILFLCPSLAGAGVERRVCTLLKHLDQTNHRFFLGILRNKGQFMADVANDRVVFVEKPFWLKFVLPRFSFLRNINIVIFGIYQIYKIIEQTKPDLIVTFTLETSFPTYFVKLLGKGDITPWIISEDSNTAEAIDHSVNRPILAMLGLKIFSKMYHKADYITSVSHSLKESLKTGFNLPDQKINVIYNPVDIESILSSMNLAVANPIKEQYLIAIGRLEKVKQYGLLLEAFALVRKDKILKLVILGEGSELGNLQTISKRLGIAEHVIFIGFTANPWAYITHAEALLLTSRQEGFSIVIVESMIAGCPVISTRSGGPEEIIKHDRNGILVTDNCQNIADETIRLLEQKTLRRRMINEARKHAARFEPKKICPQISEMFDRIMAQKTMSRAIQQSI